ncbi:DUF1517 domain-containing protein [Deinococcus maricopensis]|nr:DUF1517 domain-containing protein [Deinococcus maricopensis]
MRRTLLTLLKVLMALTLVGATLDASAARKRSGGGFGGSSRSSSRSSSTPSRSAPSSSRPSTLERSAPRTSTPRVTAPTYVTPTYVTPSTRPNVVVTSGPVVATGGYGVASSGGTVRTLLLVLLLIIVVVVIVVLVRRRAGRAGSVDAAHALLVQVLLADNDDVKRALQRVASDGDPDAPGGLASMLREAVLVLLRHEQDWVFGDVRHLTGDRTRAEQQVSLWATQARAAFEVQTTANYQDGNEHTGLRRAQLDDAALGGQPVAVTIAAAVLGASTATPGPANHAAVRTALMGLAALPADLLASTEVVWSPDTPGEFITQDEAILKYPSLTRL